MKNHLQGYIITICLFFLLSIIISSCGLPSNSLFESKNNPALPAVNMDELLLKDQVCFELIEAQINAWKSRDIENLKQVYTNDIVHFDGRPMYAGIDEVTQMAKNTWGSSPKWEMSAGDVYISNNECVGEWINWNIFTFSQDEPGIEFDLIKFNNSQISFWRALFDRNFWRFFNNEEQIDEDFLINFASTWSSGDKKAIANLYSRTAVYEDTLFNKSIEGSKSISNYVASYIDQFPGAEWQLLYPFAESDANLIYKDEYPFASQGGVFSITLQNNDNKPCEVHALIILTPDEGKMITRQAIYYDAESLVTCGLTK